MLSLIKYKHPYTFASLIIIGIFCAITYRSIAMGMHKDPSMWAVDAIPPVLSKMFFNHNKNYTTITEVRNKFYEFFNSESTNPDRLNIAINKLRTFKLNHTDYELLGNDDKGIVDFVNIAFKAFGAKSESILALYLTILATSCLIFGWAFKRSITHLFLLALFLSMFYLVMPSIKYNAQLTSIIALRVFPLISVVACLHCLCFILEKSNDMFDRRMSMQIFLVFLQILLICFAVHIRTTAIWQIYVILLTSIIIIIKDSFVLKFKTGRSNLNNQTHILLAVLLIVIITYGALNLIRATAFPKEYHKGQQIITRVFWHNIYSGFALNPFLAEKFNLRIDDHSIISATSNFLEHSGRLSIKNEIFGENYQIKNWAKYDMLTKQMLYDTCQRYFRECALSFVYYKPLSLLENIAWLYGIRKYPADMDVYVSKSFGDIVKKQFIHTTDLLDQNKQRIYLFANLPIIIVLIPFVFLLKNCGYQKKQSTHVATILILLIGSSIPNVIGYPGAHTIAEVASVFGLAMYFIFALVILWFFSLCTKYCHAIKSLYNPTVNRKLW